MPYFAMNGGFPLKGEITVQGSKNAVLPMMAAAVLHRGITVFTNVPEITDVSDMAEILEHLGCSVSRRGDVLLIDARVLENCEIPREMGRKMRSSIMLLGAVLGRLGKAVAYHPGGCCIGARPVDLHCRALEQLGAEVDCEEDQITVRARRLTGGEIFLPFPSVGATENAILAAVAASGETRIEGCAREPEIFQLCQFLVGMGARIVGIGSSSLRIAGGEPLHDVCYRVEGDRIAAATYLYGAAACRGEVTVEGICPEYLKLPLEMLEKTGCRIERWENAVKAVSRERLKALPFVQTEVYPGFPTDLQPLWMSIMALADGTAGIRENIFEARFQAAGELIKMGAEITVEGRRAWVTGKKQLAGQRVKAHDLRCGAALVLAGLAAKGQTRVDGIHYIKRGYEDLPGTLRELGARITEEQAGDRNGKEN